MATLKVRFKAIDEISSAFAAMTQSGEKALETFESAGAAADTALGNVSKTASETAKSIDSTTDAVTDAAESVEKYTKTTTQATDTTDGLSDTASKTGQTLGDEGDAAEKAGKQIGDYGDKSEEAGKKGEEFGKKSSDGIEKLQNILASAGIAHALDEIKDAFVSTAEASIEFESAITGVYKTVDGTDEQLAAISDEVKSLSTTIPATTTEIAGVAEAAGQLGIATEDVMSFSKVMINLGESTNLSADEAASSLAKFTNITGTSASEYENLGSTIVALGNNFATTESDITQMATRMASAATLAGMTESDILALAASLSSVGVEADAGGSAMSTLISNMQLAVETGDGLSEYASVAGYSAQEFAQAFGEDAAGALYAFIDGLNDTVRNGASATAVLADMDITEIRLSNAIKALANNSDSLGYSLEFASDAWEENTALAKEAGTRYGTTESKIDMMKNAANNLSIAFGDVLTPAIADGAEILTSFLTGLTSFVEEHPAVVAAITAVAAGVTVFVAGLTAYTAVTNIASIATAAFTAALNANPIFLAVTGVVALTAAVGTLVAVVASADDEYEDMTATSKEQYDQLQDLNAEYEEACEKYGETSEEASRLRYEMDSLNSEFEANKQTVEAFVSECDSLVESHNSLMESYSSGTSSIKDNELGTLALIQRLQELASQNEQTGSSYDEMKAIIQQLNTDIPGLSLNYDDLMDNVDGTAEAMQRMAEAQAESELQTERQQAYVDLLKEQATLQDQIAEAEANLNAERERRGMYQDEETGQWTNGTYTEDSPFAAWTTDLDEYSDALDELNAAYAENQAALAEIKSEWEDVAEATQQAAEEQVSYEDAVTTAVEGIQGDLNELCKKYKEAKEEAEDSINSTIGLFDTMKTSTEISVSGMTTALQSQVDFLNTYTENLKKAAEYGLDNGLIASLSDGSAESAGYVNAIIEQIEKLGGSAENMPAAAANFVDNFNEKFSEVSIAKDEFTTVAAEMKTDFDTEMTGIEARMDEAIDNMNMEEDAAKAAKETISAYVEAIRSMTGEAGDAAAAVAAAAQSKLGNLSYAPSTTVTGHASGTVSAQEDVYIAGEEGPELIVGARGSEVFPAQETERILNAIQEEPTVEQPSPVEQIAVSVAETSQPIEDVADTVQPTDTAQTPVDTATDAAEAVSQQADGAEPQPVTTAAQQPADAEAWQQQSVEAWRQQGVETVAQMPDSAQAIIARVAPDLVPPSEDISIQPTGFDPTVVPDAQSVVLTLLPYLAGYTGIDTTALTTAAQQPADAEAWQQQSVEAMATEPPVVTEQSVNITAQQPAASEQPPIETSESVPLTSTETPAETSAPAASSERRIVIEINGSGSIDVTGGVDEEEVVRILEEHMKPVLMSIVKEEMFEEGDLSYDY